MKAIEKLTFDSVTIRTVSIPMRRPIVAKVGTRRELRGRGVAQKMNQLSRNFGRVRSKTDQFADT